MKWLSGEDKRLTIMRTLDRDFQYIIEKIPNINTINEIKNLYFKFIESEPIDNIEYGSALLPEERIPMKILDEFSKEDLNIHSNKPLLILIEKGFSIAALDSSVFDSGPHLFIDIILVNVGYWYACYGLNNGGDGSYCKIYPGFLTNTEKKVVIKQTEKEALLKIFNNINSSTHKKFLFLDESLNLAYTLNFDKESRINLVKALENNIEEAIKMNIIPIGIFYTRVSDILRGMSAIMNKDLQIYGHIPDRLLIDNIIEIGARTPYFKVYSKPLLDSNIELLAFYLKIDNGNVLRIEFPEKFKNYIDDIHLAVLAQSILGEGYPLALQRAHELAVLTKDDRKIIELEIARKLKIPIIEKTLSKKEVSKRWPIA